MIYLDHNATTPVAPRVFEAMVPCLLENWGNPSSPYRFGNQARTMVERARQRIADCVVCSPAELVFCSSGTESDNLALRGVARALRGKGRHIVVSAIEHHAVLHTCHAMEREGYHVSYVPVTADGVVDLGAFAEAVALAFEEGNGEGRRQGLLRDRLERKVRAAIRGVQINGVKAPRVSNTSSLCFEAVDGESIVLGLDMQGICVSTGSACSTGELEPSHVLRALGLSPRQAQGTIRVSLGRDTTEQGIEATVRALSITVDRLRQISTLADGVE